MNDAPQIACPNDQRHTSDITVTRRGCGLACLVMWGFLAVFVVAMVVGVHDVPINVALGAAGASYLLGTSA